MFEFYMFMKISAIRHIKHFVGIASVTAAMTSMVPQVINARPERLTQDVFTQVHKVPAEGTKDSLVLAGAPSPDFKLFGEEKKAAVVVDLSQNVLYQYDEKGNAVEAFLVASGRKSSPTPKSINSVLRVETYPYRTAPASTKRRKSPKSFGPNAIILGEIDLKTGKKVETGIYIHGNNDYKSLGRYESKGCIRMDNEVIKRLAKQIKHGHFVLIK